MTVGAELFRWDSCEPELGSGHVTAREHRHTLRSGGFVLAACDDLMSGR
jgi:hypothetical protein